MLVRDFLRPKMRYQVVVLLLLQFLFRFSQGQGPGKQTFQISEGLDPGAEVGTIQTQNGYRYEFAEDSIAHQYFSLAEYTGHITTLVNIDREALDLPENKFYLLIIGKSGQSTTPVEISIEVLDINDNSPTFPNRTVLVTLQENIKNGTQKMIPTATDIDAGQNAMISEYQLVSGDGPFRLVYNQDLYGNVLFLETTGLLDRETRDSYRLTISAHDGGSPSRSGTAVIQISIMDINDNPPIFAPSTYEAKVNETDEVGTFVIQIAASDRDIGVNKDLTYRFVDANTHASQFRIEETTGKIFTTTTPLVCPGSCLLTVEARDGGNPSYPGRAFVYISVKDNNNHDPEIIFQYMPRGTDNKFSTVNENANDGTFVAGIEVRDQDTGINGQTSLEMIAGNELQHFRMLKVAGFIFIKVNGEDVLDRERHDVYNITFKASDGGTPPRTSLGHLVIYVNDINDYAPQFTQSNYRVELSETAPIGSFVANLNASDRDTGVNAKLTYRILNDQPWFNINENTGLVTVKTKLHYEIQHIFQMNISVHDGALQPLYDYAQLVVSIWDENDKIPQFTKSVFEVSLAENLRSGAPVVIASAEDQDTGMNGTIRYEFHPDVPLFYNNTFHLTDHTGSITTTRSLDCEEREFYTLYIIAKDQGPNPQSSTATVNLRVLDENDNSPLFYPTVYYATVLENQQGPVDVVMVSATDSDKGTNAQLTYKVSGSDFGKFSVDPSSGLLKTTQPLSKQIRSSYTITIKATDTGNLESTNSATVEVMVVAEADQPPYFTNPLDHSISIPEDTVSSQSLINNNVHQVNARTEQFGTAIIYTIADGDTQEHFTIDRSSGWIKRKKNIDREITPVFSLVVVATTGAHFASTFVNITVDDINDNPPEFARPSVTVDIIENWPVGHHIKLVKATDRDEGANAHVTYSLATDVNNVFAIESNTGLLYMNKPVGMLSSDDVVLAVTATDSGTPQYSATQELNVRLIDVNNYTPKFDHATYEVSLNESHPVNDRFLHLLARDDDVGINSQIIYNITRGNEDQKFGIFPDGFLYIAKELDRETKDLYKLSVIATDRGYKPRSSECNITIHVTDTNDNKPYFVNATYNLQVTENTSPGTVVGSVKARDFDMGRNAELSYFLDDDQKDFAVDSQTGQIKTLKSFDREELQNQDYTFSFDVTVKDNGIYRLQDIATVRVTILDENDNKPVFAQSPYKVSIPENAAFYSNVTIVKATDPDDGINSIVTYQIIEGNDDDKFEINPTTGQITVKGILDRETEDSYKLKVKATDSGSKVMFSTVGMVYITILDINDNTPLFATTSMEITVPEDKHPGMLVAQFSATDIDLGRNGNIRYTVSGADNEDTFMIDSHTGNIYIMKDLDFEKKEMYNLNVTAWDYGSPPLSFNIRFLIKIQDVNDNRPIFLEDRKTFRVTEGNAGSVGVVSASDADSGQNREIKYKILFQDPPGNNFNIIELTGEIYISGKVDREIADMFNLTIIAVDQAMPPETRLTSEAVIHIFVDDENDNSPEFISVNAIKVPQTTGLNANITAIRTYDPDAGNNGKIALTLIEGDSNLFTLDNSGRLLLTKTLPASPVKYALKIRARDYGTPSRSAEQSFTVIVTGMDGGPQFQDASYSGSIAENSEVGRSVVKVQAVSTRNSPVEYYVTSVVEWTSGLPVGRYFQVDKFTGVVSPAVVLDSDTMGENFRVEICAVDTSGDKPRTSFMEVQIQVTDQNDTPPKFSQNFYYQDVPENVVTGNTVARVTVSDDEQFGSVYLNITNGNDDSFRLHQDGSVVTTQKLDRETSPQYTLRIQATDGIQTSFCLLRLNLQDVNDNPPMFLREIYSFDIPEDTPVDTIIGVIRAEDGDSGAGGMVTYYMTSDWSNNIFDLDPNKGTFTLRSVVDFEQNELYTLVIGARDGGTSPLSSTVVVYFNVKDVNDNTPLFDPVSYDREIFEDVHTDTSVVQVSATDIDSGVNGEVLYSLEPSENEEFYINENTGVIFTKALLDRETTPSYTLTVHAIDQADDINQRKTGVAQVSVVLRDKNDFTPEFISPSTIHVRENLPQDTVVHTIITRDLDAGINSQVEYSLPPTTVSYPFSIGLSDGKLRVDTILDRETVQNYTMTIVATDRGTPRLSATQTLLIKIEDENDNNPVFSPEYYSDVVAEDIPIGTTLLQVSATDTDAGLNGIVRYFIIGGDDNYDFSIDQSSGVLRVQKNLDYERVQEYSLIIQAEDSGSDVNMATATVSVAIRDVNDNLPVFLDSPYIGFVLENRTSGGVHVLQVSARDADSPPFNDLHYFIREVDQTLFNISEDSGEIMSLKTLDREQQAEYHLTVIAKDSTSGSALTGTGTVSIFVEDINDNPPVFENPAGYVAHVHENALENTTVVTVMATDLDEGINAQLIYSLKDSIGNRFTIYADTGRIATTTQLDREENAEYLLEVIAHDASILPISATTTVRVYVDDENDNTPTFDLDQYVLTVLPPANSGDFVFGVTAIDADVGDNGLVQYSLLADDDASFFRIDSETGIVTASQSLTAGHTYHIKITASDQGSQPRRSNVTATIQVATTIPSNLPTFDSIPTNVKVRENSNYNSPVTTLRAQLPNGVPPSYSIVGGNTAHAFGIDSGSGRIFVSGEVDYEIAATYHLWIQAKDSESQTVWSNAELVIGIEDENDNYPRFMKLQDSLEVYEDRSFRSTLTTVTAEDADSGDNGKIDYSLDGDDASSFNITSSGKISIFTNLDREKKDLYNLIIVATDNGSPRLTSTSSVRVIVLDRNDNPPRFTRLFNVKVAENTEVGSFVIRVTSSDLDIGNNAIAHYSLEDSAMGKFSIDEISGNITLQKPLDAEQVLNYRLRVTASDGSHTVQTNVEIVVTDVNDNSPVMHAPFSFNFPEQQPVGSVVGVLTASDADQTEPNNLVYYSLKLPSTTFNLDSDTGTITSLEEMEYQHSPNHPSPVNRHELVVLVKDLGTPPKSSEATIFINIVDYNNHAPVFQESSYFSPVPVNANIDSSILTVEARDEFDYGVNAEVEYSITAGTGRDYFKVHRTSGVISVANSLVVPTGTQLDLTVKALDKGSNPQSSTVQVRLTITGINVHAPRFVLPTDLRVTMPENIDIGHEVTRFSATDDDTGLNGELTYTITSGNDNGLFSLGSNGVLTVVDTLDYEFAHSHTLTITAKDKGLVYKTAMVAYVIDLTDLNDNNPVFKNTEEQVFITEDSKVGTLVFDAVATDDDEGQNAVIEYNIVGDAEAQRILDIKSATGQITLKETLDYETRKSYTAYIMAFNPNESSSRKSTLTLKIEVDGVNEFVPKFERAIYYFNANESDSPGTFVGRVSATDDDDGQDGIVYYFLIGESNQRGFKIHPRTGEITVNNKLDYESTNSIRLDVLVKNWGSVKGNDTDTCVVNISLKDSNDAPVFTEEIYEGYVEEGSGAGVRIITVSATDSDAVLRDRNFSYVILAGNEANLFKISPISGEIWTTGYGELDRESTPVYNITVGAQDTGEIPQTGSALVKIHLEDINDNGPEFIPFVAKVTEGQNKGVQVITLTQITRDPDGVGNGSPFTYRKSPGNPVEYTVFNIDERTGLVTTIKSLDREEQEVYHVPVIVADGGTPTMSSSLTFTVKVADKNDSPPTARLLTAFVSVFNGRISSEPVANVQPMDADTTGDYSCTLVSTSVPFMIPPSSCDLVMNANPVEDSYTLTVEGSDGSQYPSVIYDVSIKILNFDNITMEHSTVLRLHDVSVLLFVENFYSHFVSACEQLFDDVDTVTVLGLRPASSGLLIFLSVKKDSGDYYLTEIMNTKLRNGKGTVESSVGVTITEIGFTNCSASFCLNNGNCVSKVVVTGDTVLANTSHRSLSYPELMLDVHCDCLPQYSGPYCGQEATPCGNTYCQNGGVCVNSGNGNECQCPESWTGISCEQDVDECETDPCQNGATCYNTHGSFACVCRDGFFNNLCQDGFDYCQSSPCESGECRNVDGNFHCSCPYGYWGNKCQYRSIGFNVGSFLESKPVDPVVNEIEIVFATNKKNSLLMYNPAVNRNSKEFIALEILNGHIRFSIALGTQTPTRVTIPVNVATGDWFKVKISRNRFTSSVWVSECPEDGSQCKECEMGTPCYQQGNRQGNETLEVGSQLLSIGGIRDIAVITDRPGQVSSHDFVGCIRSFIINNEDRLQESQSDQLGQCPRSTSSSLCDSWVCENGGICVDVWTGPVCRCSSNNYGPHCEKELKPFGFSKNSMVMITMKESFRRDLQIAKSNRARRSVSTESSVLIRFRTTSQNGLLLFTSTNSGNRFSVVSVLDGKLQFTAGQFGAVSSTTIRSPTVSDGKWHNATVVITGAGITLELDGQHKETSSGEVVWFTDLDVKHLSLGGAEQSITIDNTALKDFDGCISVFELDRSPLPLNGSTDKFDIQPSPGDGIENGCSSLCNNDPCSGGACSVEGEVIVCAPAPGEGDPILSIGVIVVIAFFGVLIIAIIALFLLFRYKRHYFKCIKGEKYRSNSNTLSKSANSSGHSHGDSGFGENQIDEMIIRNHIQQELAGNPTRMNGRLMRPDIIESEVTGRRALPLDLEDGTVIIDNASDLTHLRDLNGDVPEHYDLENASSIAPSDIDVIDHYRHFHNPSKHRRKTKGGQSNHSSQQYSSHSSSHVHDAPNKLTSVPYMNDLTRNSPAMRNSPINQLSRQSPNVRQSPLTHVNMRGMPVTELNNASRGTSEHSRTSHHSHHSSSAPHKPKRQMLPNGNMLNKNPQTDANRKPNNNYENKQFLTLDEVNQLNSRPHESPASLMEAVSSSSENNPQRKTKPVEQYHDTSVLLEPPLSSSDDSANDSFTCSEFEFENEKPRNDFDPSSRIFSNLAEVENENEDGAYHNKTYKADGLDSGGNSFSSNVGSSDEGLAKTKPINGTFNWDDLLNWGPKFEKLVGVFTDIALLPDGENSEIGEIEGKTPAREEYV